MKAKIFLVLISITLTSWARASANCSKNTSNWSILTPTASSQPATVRAIPAKQIATDGLNASPKGS